MLLDVKIYLSEKLREEFEIACVRAALASLVLLALLQWPLMQYFDEDIVNLSATGFLIFALTVRLSLVWLKKIKTDLWLKLHNLVMVLISCAWSVILFNVTTSPIAKTELHIFTHLVFAGLVASSAFTLSISKRDFYAFVFPLITSQTLAFAIFTSVLSYRIAILGIMSIFFVFLLKQRSRFAANWATALTKNFELQKIIDAMPGGVIVIRSGIYSLINKTVKQVFAEAADLIGQSIKNFNNIPEAALLNAEIKKFADSDLSETQFEIDLNIKSKKQTHLVNAIKINATEMMISTLDISDRKRSEEEINAHKARSFKNAKMVLLGEISEGLAHEINNAMATISMKSQQLQYLSDQQSQISSEDIKKNLRPLDLKIAHITSVVKDLRSISKGSVSSPKTSVLVSDVVNTTLNLCRVKFEGNGVSIIDEIDQNIKVECISSQISQVLLTALYNSFEAVQKLDEKWIKIFVRVVGSKIQVVVQDSGKGIPENIRAKVMSPFFTTKENNTTTGLGLSLSKEIIEAHNGRLYFNYENTNNTELIIELPA